MTPTVAETRQAVPVLLGTGLGWFHAPPAGCATGRGLVLCGAEGHEALGTLRGMWDLATRCATAGLAVLRLDYPGSGDSPGEDGPGRLEAARDTILRASDWLRAESGMAEVALCGLRLGAMLAAQAAARQPGQVTALALLAPVVSGRTHLRRAILMAQAGSLPCPAWLEVAGQRLHPDDAADLAVADLWAAVMAARVPRLLLLHARQDCVGPAGGPAGSEAVELHDFEGAAAFLAEAHASRLPSRDFARVAAWLAQDAPAAAQAVPPAVTPVVPLAGGLTEEALRFGPGGRLAGVVCAPVPGAARRTGVLVLNTGANPRAGVGRLGVRLARRLAADGTMSLRFDAAGLGDSDAHPGPDATDAPPDLYRDDVWNDARAGLDFLASRGVARCLVVGICSGAHVALQLALRDPRVDGIALFNLPAFDRSAGGAPALDGGPPPGETPALRRPRMLLRRLLAETDRFLAHHGRIESGLDRPGRWMRQLAARKVQVLLCYSARDRGLRELRAHFGREGRRLSDLPLMRRVLLEGTNHSLAPRAMQDQALRLIEEQVQRLDAPLQPPRPVAATEDSRAEIGGAPLPAG